MQEEPVFGNTKAETRYDSHAGQSQEAVAGTSGRPPVQRSCPLLAALQMRSRCTHFRAREEKHGVTTWSGLCLPHLTSLGARDVRKCVFVTVSLSYCCYSLNTVLLSSVLIGSSVQGSGSRPYLREQWWALLSHNVSFILGHQPPSTEPDHGRSGHLKLACFTEARLSFADLLSGPVLDSSQPRTGQLPQSGQPSPGPSRRHCPVLWTGPQDTCLECTYSRREGCSLSPHD